MVCCPLTTQIKSYPFEVVITGTPSGVVLADQVKSLDWRQRQGHAKGDYLLPNSPTCAQKFAP